MKIKIAIATNVSFHEKTLPIVLASLREVGIANEDIAIFIAGCKSKEVLHLNNIKHYLLDYASYELSPLIEIAERELEGDYWFLLQDTCKVGPNFKRLLYEVPATLPNKVALRPKPSMNMGLYKTSYLVSLKETLSSYKNKDYSEEGLKKFKHWVVTNEDIVLWSMDPQPFIYGNRGDFYLTGHDNWYGTGSIRRTEYYPALDLYKNKSNWGQSPVFLKDL